MKYQPTDPKFEKLKNLIRSYKKVAVAFSGGVDSSFLLKVSMLVLGRDNVLGLVADTPGMPRQELNNAVAFARTHSIELVKVKYPELIAAIRNNPVNRCYLCKNVIFKKFLKIAAPRRISVLIDGTNFDDRKDTRPGRVALKELGVQSPLEMARITKKEVRAFSKKLGLSSHAQPPMACLFTRFPHGTELTAPDLVRVAKAEALIRGNNNFLVRVRVHDNIARVEVEPDKIQSVLKIMRQKSTLRKLTGLGFSFISLDVHGYKTGSMNS